MLQLFSTGLIPLWLEATGMIQTPPTPNPSVLSLLLLDHTDPSSTTLLDSYLNKITQAGFSRTCQGLWLQTSDQLLMNHAGDHPLPAASLTKIATTLTALKTWDPDHQFVTDVSATGPIRDGIVEGDLIIAGGGDPLLVWPEAITLGNTLNQRGIKRVKGNLITTGLLAMNFQSDQQQVEELLIQSFNAQRWSAEVEDHYAKMSPGTPRPQLTFDHAPLLTDPGTGSSTRLIRHYSLPLFELLKQMNVHSNNDLAQMLADQLGGASTVVQTAVSATGVPQREVMLTNGSGLGQENRLSARVVVGLLQAIQQELHPHDLTIADVFPMSGRDRGTIEERRLPQAAVVKTGTLWNVSALAGIIPTRQYGPVWFTIINRGENIEGFRQEQDRFLQALTQHWGIPQSLPALLKPLAQPQRWGDPARNQVLP